MQFSPIRGCFSQMFVLQKEFLFARGLNWDQSCLWKTPPSHFLLFSPLACPYFFNFFSSPDFWGVKEAPCKNLYVFGENWQRNQFPKLTTFLLHFSPMSPLCHSAMNTHMGEISQGVYFPQILSLFLQLWHLFSSTFCIGSIVFIISMGQSHVPQSGKPSFWPFTSG